jgi:hypothetical protein
MSNRHPNIYNEFDLEAARKAGRADERERIIKLIENNTDFDAISNRMVFTSENWVDPCRLIELIER